MPKTEGGVQYKGVNIATINNSTIMPGSSTLNPQLSNYYTNKVPTLRSQSGMTNGVGDTDTGNPLYEMNKEMVEMNKQIYETSKAQQETIAYEESNSKGTPSQVYTQKSGCVSIPAGCKRFMAVGIGGGGGGGGAGGNAYIHVNSVGDANGEAGEGGKGGSGGYFYAIFPTMEWYNNVTYEVGGAGGGGGAGESDSVQTSYGWAVNANGNCGGDGQSGTPTTLTYGGVTYPTANTQCGGFGGGGGAGGGGGTMSYNGGKMQTLEWWEGSQGAPGNSGNFGYIAEYPSLSPYGNGGPSGNGAGSNNAGGAGNGGAIQFIWIYDDSDDN